MSDKIAITSVEISGRDIELRLMVDSDRDELLDFSRSLSPHDLLFLRRDITNPKVVDAWVSANGAGFARTILAESEGRIVGCSALLCDPHSWSPHVAEIRVLVSDEFRNHGLGRYLIKQTFLLSIELGVSKLFSQMTIDQHGALALFKELGFAGEALLKDHVRDQNGKLHDLVIMSCNIDSLEARFSAYGRL